MKGGIMLAQIPRPIGAIVFASALLTLGLELTLPSNIASADNCLTAPNSSAPPNKHWYYRTDWAQQRKCWYLQANGGPSEQAAVQTVSEARLVKLSQTAAADGPHSLASFKHFMAQQGHGKISDHDVEELYAEFLEWKLRNN